MVTAIGFSFGIDLYQLPGAYHGLRMCQVRRKTEHAPEMKMITPEGESFPFRHDNLGVL